MTVLRPELQAALRAQADVAEGRRIRRARQRGAAAVVMTAVVTLVLAFGPLHKSGGLLSPQQAVAAVRSDLASNGIVEWLSTADFLSGVSETDGRGDGTTSDSLWADLENGDRRHEVELQPKSGRLPGAAIPRFQTWVIGRSLWTAAELGVPSTPPSKSPRDLSTDELADNPISQVRAALDRAARGEANLRDDVEVDGTPAVLVTDHPNDKRRLTTRTWLSREDEPRVLKYEVTEPCTPAFCGGRTAPITSTYVTDKWVVHPRTPEFLSKLALPEGTG